jgi:nucleotide-binding universal stress UspA family protein
MMWSSAGELMFKKLLVPLDGSALAEQALGQAAAIARRTGATIDLVTVHQAAAFDGYGEDSANEEQWRADHEYLEAVVTELADGASIGVTHSMLAGDPAVMICRHALDIDADLIVMTSHGRTGFSRLWFGSVADGTVQASTVPVLMLRPLAGDGRRGAARQLFERIVVPLDGSATARQILAPVMTLAKCSGARVTLLGVVQPIPSASYNPATLLPYAVLMNDSSVTDIQVESATKELAALAKTVVVDGAGVVDAQVVVAGSVATGIVEFARSHDADLIALSTHGRGASRLLIGGVADKVLRASRLPMLILRATPVAEDNKQTREPTAAYTGAEVHS